MKKVSYLILSIVIVISAIGIYKIQWLYEIAGQEVFPADEYLDVSLNRSALIVTAHDDDIIGATGTLKELTSHGWDISQMCFYQTRGLDAQKDNYKNPIRKKDLATVNQMLGISAVYTVDQNLRRDMNIERPWYPIRHEDIIEEYYIDSLYQRLDHLVKKHKPSVIFTLDNLVGGYGHPDHVLISQLILKYCKDMRNQEDFSVEKIYQLVFSPSQAHGVMKDMDVYLTAKSIYKNDGMPTPTVEIDISEHTKLKKEAMLSYSTEQNSLTNIWPGYDWLPHWMYFGILDKEYFRVIDIDSLPEEEMIL